MNSTIALERTCASHDMNASLGAGHAVDKVVLEQAVKDGPQAQMHLLAKNRKISEETATVLALERAFKIHKSLADRANLQAEHDELEHLVRATEVERELIAQERFRRAHNLSQLRLAHDVRSRVVAEGSHTVSRAELERLQEAQAVHEDLCEREELHHLVAALRIHESLCAREEKRLETEELEHLAHAVRVEQALMRREEAVQRRAEAFEKATYDLYPSVS
jgi:hypothetical protein